MVPPGQGSPTAPRVHHGRHQPHDRHPVRHRLVWARNDRALGSRP